MTAHNDLAASGLLDTFVPEQMLAGDKDITTNQGILAVGPVVKYQLMAKHATDGTVHPFVPGTDTIPQAVIASQPGVVGQHVPYFEEIYFNTALVVVAAGDGSLNTAVKLKSAFNGLSGIRFGTISPGA